MARNIVQGDSNNFIPFNCYRGIKNDKGRLVKAEKPFARIFGRFEVINTSRGVVSNVVNAENENTTIITSSQNTLTEVDYLENKYSGEIWKIDEISKTVINNEAFESSCRCQYEYRLVCSR